MTDFTAITANTGEDIAVVLTSPQRYLLLDLLAQAQNSPRATFDDYNSVDPDDIDEFIDKTCKYLLDSKAVPTILKTQDYFLFLPQFATAHAGGALVFNAASNMGGFVNQGAGTASDSMIMDDSFYMRAGTWKISVMFIKAVNGAKINFDIVHLAGGAQTMISQLDTYNATTLLHQFQRTSFVLTASDTQTLKWYVNGRNASNTTGWVADISQIILQRTGD